VLEVHLVVEDATGVDAAVEDVARTAQASSVAVEFV
jgi:hypothetical protein